MKCVTVVSLQPISNLESAILCFFYGLRQNRSPVPSLCIAWKLFRTSAKRSRMDFVVRSMPSWRIPVSWSTFVRTCWNSTETCVDLRIMNLSSLKRDWIYRWGMLRSLSSRTFPSFRLFWADRLSNSLCWHYVLTPCGENRWVHIFANTKILAPKEKCPHALILDRHLCNSFIIVFIE